MFLRSIHYYLIILLLVGCGRKEESVDSLVYAKYLLNQFRYEEASRYLNKFHQENPENDQVIILYASALNGTIGINIIDSFEILRYSLFNKPVFNFNENSFDNLESEKTSDSSFDLIKQFELEILKISAAAKEAFTIASKIPYIKKDKRPLVIKSLNLLAKIKKDSTSYQSSQIYSSILHLMQFVNYFRDSVKNIDTSGKKEWYINFVCHMDLSSFLENLNDSSRFLDYSFQALHNSKRMSHSTIYKNLKISRDLLVKLSGLYEENKHLVNQAKLAHELAKNTYCLPSSSDTY